MGNWVHKGEVSSPPVGMYSLAQLARDRTMHWVKKPVTTSPIDEVLFELVTELVPLAPLSSNSGLESMLSWAGDAAKELLKKNDPTKMRDLLSKFIDKSQYDLAMSQQKKFKLAQRIEELLTAIKKLLDSSAP